ncbi:MAG: phosphatidate cytidylyltransferase [Gammaproteobacteria bacterium]|nr:phosphatidate cytidylyltransferase [Gammaproteobacteria bacterium]
MLKERLLTALLLAPLFVLSIIYLPSHLFALLVGVFVVLAAWEWSGLLGVDSSRVRTSYVVCVFLLAVPLYLQPGVTIVLAFGLGWWLFVIYQLVAGVGRRWSLLYRVLSGLIVLVTGWYAVYSLHYDTGGPRLLLIFFALIWAADIGAYFVGRAWGKRRLAPNISPGKTVEGVIGGLVSVGSVSICAGILFLNLRGMGWLEWLSLCAATAIASVVGDLFESQLKRVAGVKDSCSLLPGHGGVLDRIDGVTASAPVFALGWWWLLGPEALQT